MQTLSVTSSVHSLDPAKYSNATNAVMSIEVDDIKMTIDGSNPSTYGVIIPVDSKITIPSDLFSKIRMTRVTGNATVQIVYKTVEIL